MSNIIISLSREKETIAYKSCICPKTKERVTIQLSIPKEARIVFYKYHGFPNTWSGRAEFVDVIEIFKEGITVVESFSHAQGGNPLLYEIGKRAYCEGKFDPGAYISKPGIHFTLSRECADSYDATPVNTKEVRLLKIEEAIRQIGKAVGLEVLPVEAKKEKIHPVPSHLKDILKH
jgi:hypothetical protein